MERSQRHSRSGAQGARKLKTGCRTCKYEKPIFISSVNDSTNHSPQSGRIRRKKCDEAKPSCLRCITARFHCDFIVNPATTDSRHLGSLSPNAIISSPDTTSSRYIHHLSVLSSFPPLHAHASLYNPISHYQEHESGLFDYFRLVCAKEFTLYFDDPIWGDLILRLVHHEPFAYRAALAMSALSKQHYLPSISTVHTDQGDVAVHEFATIEYMKAIRLLNSRISDLHETGELAVLGSIMLVNLEFLLAQEATELSPMAAPVFTKVHIDGAGGIICHYKQEGRLQTLNNHRAFESAIQMLQYQLLQFQLMSSHTFKGKLYAAN
jgi:hypothetical protein